MTRNVFDFKAGPPGGYFASAAAVAGCLLMQAVVLLVLSVGVVNAQDYEIRFSRPIKIGDRFRLAASGREVDAVAVSAGERMLQQKTDEIDVNLIAILTALEVDRSGKPSRFSIEIEKINVAPTGFVTGRLAPGAVVIGAFENQRFVFSVNGTPLDALSHKILSVVVPTYQTEVSDDEVFGTPERKKVGDRWPINAEVAARALNQTFKIKVHRDNLSGTSTLDGVVKQGSAEYLVIGANMRVDNFDLPLPDGMRLQRGIVEGVFSGRFPVNLARPPLNQSLKLSAQFSGIRLADATTPELTIKGAFERSVQREFEALQ